MPIRTPAPVLPGRPASASVPDQTDGAPVSGTEYALPRSLRVIWCTARTPGRARSAGNCPAGTVTARPVSSVRVR